MTLGPGTLGKECSLQIPAKHPYITCRHYENRDRTGTARQAGRKQPALLAQRSKLEGTRIV